MHREHVLTARLNVFSTTEEKLIGLHIAYPAVQLLELFHELRADLEPCMRKFMLCKILPLKMKKKI